MEAEIVQPSTICNNQYCGLPAPLGVYPQDFQRMKMNHCNRGGASPFQTRGWNISAVTVRRELQAVGPPAANPPAEQSNYLSNTE
jgi:hypothetical protein